MRNQLISELLRLPDSWRKKWLSGRYVPWVQGGTHISTEYGPTGCRVVITIDAEPEEFFDALEVADGLGYTDA